MLLLVAGAVVLLANPRHRAFYFGLVGRGPVTLPLPSSSRLIRPAAAPQPHLAVTVEAAVHVPTEDGQGRVRVPVTDDQSVHLPSAGVPLGWEMKEFTGDASVELVRNEGHVALHLRSERTSFALHRDVVLDIRQYPILTWSWKVVRLPPGGDVRDPARDDQAAQIYVIFPRWPAPTRASDILGYVWDSRAPAGTALQHPRAANVQIVVVESGSSRLDTWVRERRNVAEDYQALFGRLPPRLAKVALMIDSNDTRSAAEALFGDLIFSKPGAAGAEIPVSMLR